MGPAAVLTVILPFALLASPLAAGAQPESKIARIGFLSNAVEPTPRHQSFVQGLRDLGYVEGQHFVMEYRYAAGMSERLLNLAAELVRAWVDVIVAAAGTAAWPASQTVRAVPVVFLAAHDPVGRGIVASLARPGGNVTGVALDVGPAKHLQLLAETVPTISRVVYLYTPSTEDEYAKTYIARLKADARTSNVKLQSIAIRQPGEIGRTFSKIERTGEDGLLIDNQAVLLRARERICALAGEQRLPAMGLGREFAEADCLMSYGENLEDIYRRGAFYVDKILKGTKPADLPVEQPTKFELVVNLKTAKALGLTIPPSVLARVDEVIE